MASAKDFPDLIPEGDPILGNSYRHYYGGSYYHLLFPTGRKAIAGTYRPPYIWRIMNRGEAVPQGAASPFLAFCADT